MPRFNELAPLLQDAGAVIFDFDGTLYDAHGFILRLNLTDPWYALRMLSEHQTRKSLRGNDFGNADAFYDEFFTRFAARWRRPAALLRKWHFEHNLNQQCRTLAAFRARPEVLPLFASLKAAGIPMAVFSDYEQVAERMEAIGLTPGGCGISPDHLYGPERFGALKPAVRPFRIIAEELGVPPEKVVVVGDHDNTDGEGARNAGMRFLLVD